MRVLLVTHKYPPQKGGVGVSAQRIARGMTLWCEAVHTLHSTRDLEPGMVSQAMDEKVVVFTAGESDRAAESGQLLEATIRALHEAYAYDVVIGFYAVPTGFTAIFTGKLLGVKTLLCLRGNDLDRALYHPGQLAMLTWALTASDRVVGVSRELVQKAELVSGRRDIAFVANSVDPKQFFPGDTPGEERHLLFTGEMRLKKGSTPLLACLPQLKGPWQLTLAGGFRGQAEAEFRRFLTSYPDLSSRVRRLPYCRDYEQLRALYHEADLVISPALWDGMPNSVLEAMACGKPVLAADVGGVKDLLEDGVTGYLLGLSQLGELHTKIEEIFDDPRRHQVGANARSAVVDRFSPDSEARAYRELLLGLGQR